MIARFFALLAARTAATAHGGRGSRGDRGLFPCCAEYACFVEAASRFLDRAVVAGGPRVLRGYFPSLEHTFGTGAFDHGGLRLI